MPKITNVVIGADHRGFEYKEFLVTELKKLNINVIDVGTNGVSSVDYPNFTKEVANTIQQHYSNNNHNINGVLLCGSGIGMSISANKISPTIRAALVYNNMVAKTCKQHNNANVACFSTDHFSKNQTLEWLLTFLDSDFEGGRHQQRLDLINTLACK